MYPFFLTFPSNADFSSNFFCIGSRQTKAPNSGLIWFLHPRVLFCSEQTKYLDLVCGSADFGVLMLQFVTFAQVDTTGFEPFNIYYVHHVTFLKRLCKNMFSSIYNHLRYYNRNRQLQSIYIPCHLIPEFTTPENDTNLHRNTWVLCMSERLRVKEQIPNLLLLYSLKNLLYTSKDTHSSCQELDFR